MADTRHWSIEASVTEDGRKVLTLWVDVQDKSQNMFSSEVMGELDESLAEIEAADADFVFLRSRKPNSFFAGADIHEFLQIDTDEAAREIARRGQSVFQKLADLKATTVAVIQGVCLGGGMELALACDHRIAVIDSTTRMGLPETELGILPGWGGTQRLPRTVGLLQSIQMILQARKQTAEKALKLGLVDRAVKADQVEQTVQEVAKNPESLLQERPRSWKGWFLDETSLGRSLVFKGTEKRIARQKKHYPALGKALEAIRLSFEPGDAGYQYAQEASAELLFSETCQSLVSLIVNRERARSIKTWDVPDELSNVKVSSIGILGGGTMGAGIAHAGIKKGIDVVLKEVNEEALDAARGRVSKTYETLLSRRSLTPTEAEAEQARLTYTTGMDELKSTEVVIEAVPESLDLKQKIFQQLNEDCPETTVFATNTSALSVDDIFKEVEPKSRVGGLHFFNPVHRMDLVEVVRGESTSAETIAKLVQVSRQLGKTPVVTKDSPGFIVNRILMPYLDEAVKVALEMTARNIEFDDIDLEMKKFGMPMGPLELLDQVGIDVAAHVATSMTVVFGENSDTAKVLDRMVDGNRLGRKTEAGFYNYVKGKKASAVSIRPFVSGIDVDLPDIPNTKLDDQITPLQQRLALAMVNEAGRCLDEQVVPESWMIDLAMVLGTGFAPFRGGPLRFAKSMDHSDLIDRKSVV